SDVHEIKLWEQDSKYFIKTDVVPDILRIIENNHCVLLTGVSGIGKTLTAQNIALQLCREHRYSIIPCMSLQDIPTRYKENVHQVFVVDDICGKYTANINIIENWRNITNRVKTILDNGMTHILATCRTEVFKEKIFQQAFDLFHKNVYNLSDKYSFKDKLVIATKHFEQNDKLLADITDIINKKTFSPLMCFLCSRHQNFDINEFLSSPFDTFCKEWDNLKSFDTEKFCALLLCVIYNGTINDEILDISNDLEKDEKKKFKDIFEWCNLNRGTSRSVMQAKINVCIDTYFIKVGRKYTVIHDKMFDFLCSYFGKTLIDPILKYADDKLICERVQLESLQKEHGNFTIMVSANDEHKYHDRLTTDLENGKIHHCLNNAQMKYEEYRIKFRDTIKDLEINWIRNLINRKDENGINSFIISCLRGHDELVEFFISVGADVDSQNGFFTPLTAACHGGHLQTVEVLLEKGANINKSNSQGETPLYTACFEGHNSLVNRLIDKKAEINKQNKFSSTCLHASCMLGHATIVSLLIDKGANIFQYKDLLIAATLGGNDKIVEKLLSKGCCLNSVDIEGKTALFIACEEGNTNIVQLLIDNNADIYIVDSDGRTPLHAACCVGNNDIVRMLVNKNADVDMLDLYLETPLHKACRKGSEKVILTLLDKGADTKKTNKDGHAPVYLAKTEGKIVNKNNLKVLGDRKIGPNDGSKAAERIKEKLQKKDTACTNNSIQDGWTPLYEACVHGDIETFQSLIRYRADVNMQTISGEMPLIAACQQGHGFLIQTLLDEGADINQALVCAIQKGYDKALKILLYKVRILDYEVDGKSLIKLACEHGLIKAIKILSDQGADFTEIDINGRTLIHIACNRNSVEIIQFLIDKGLDIGIPDKYGRFALFVSIYKGFCALSKYLLQKRCPIAISEEDTKKAVISVFKSGNKELSQLLVSNGYTDNLSNFNVTMVYHAKKIGLYKTVGILRNYGSYIKKRYKYGYTPMILADIGGNDDLSENLQDQMCNNYLYRRRISISNDIIGIVYTSYIKDNSKFVATKCDLDTLSIGILEQYKDLFQACMYGDMKSPIYRTLQFNIFFNPIDPYASIWFEQTPLLLAIRRGHTEVSKFLIRHGVNVNLTLEEWRIKNDISLSTTILYGYTPLFAACQRKYYEIVDMLLDEGANLNKALYDACREGYLDTVQFLLQKGSNVNLIGRFGQTPLYAACIGGYYSIVKYLISQGALIDAKGKRASFLDEPTCLHAAYLSGNFNVVKFLINRGASVDTVGNFGRTLLQTSCRDGNYEIVKILIDKGANINASDIYGATPLIACVSQNIEHTHAERKFSQKRRDYYFLYLYGINQPLGNYHDQLHKRYLNEWRTYHKSHSGSKYKLLTDDHYKVIKLLIENGADINKTDKAHRTPLSLAKKIGDMKLTEILLYKVRLPIKKDNPPGRNQDA
ncbi:Hypothetical predicted protein, partial [Mytilus galloprovincialis]